MSNFAHSLEREVQHLQQTSNPEGSSDALVHTLRKYEALKEELDCFQKRYVKLIIRLWLTYVFV